MTVHLVKLCVGATSIDDLAQYQSARAADARLSGRDVRPAHTTFQTPKRHDDLLGGGSLYWVIKGTILVRQKIVALEQGLKDDGSACCLIVLDPVLVPVRPTPRRAFQGWRYLDATDAPPDMKPGLGADIDAMPAPMRKALADLALI